MATNDSKLIWEAVASQPKHWTNNKNVTHTKVKMYVKSRVGSGTSLARAIEMASAHYRVPTDQIVKIFLIPGFQVPPGEAPPTPLPPAQPDMDKVSRALAGKTPPTYTASVMRKPTYEQLDQLATAFMAYLESKPVEGMLGDQTPEDIENAARQLEREEDIVPRGIDRNQ